MAMTYTSLLAAKGTAGSIMNWIGYSKIDAPTILDEAQSLIYGILRAREMRTEWIFGLAASQANIPLPLSFLDPQGDIQNITDGMRIVQRDAPVVQQQRTYDPTLSGSFGTNPFTTQLGSEFVVAVLANHGINQDSTITIAGSTAVGGLTMNGTFPVVSIIDVNTLEFDAGTGNQATSNATGGGAAVTYTANNLIASTPGAWGIWNETVYFNCAFTDPKQCKLPYFKSPALLSATNQSNFLTNRYPKLIRLATTTAAAEMMKDDEEYQKNSTATMALIEQINAENDMFLRGASFGTDTPTPGDYY